MNTQNDKGRPSVIGRSQGSVQLVRFLAKYHRTDLHCARACARGTQKCTAEPRMGQCAPSAGYISKWLFSDSSAFVSDRKPAFSSTCSQKSLPCGQAKFEKAAKIRGKCVSACHSRVNRFCMMRLRFYPTKEDF